MGSFFVFYFYLDVKSREMFRSGEFWFVEYWTKRGGVEPRFDFGSSKSKTSMGGEKRRTNPMGDPKVVNGALQTPRDRDRILTSN
jgi:hypothetical protein